MASDRRGAPVISSKDGVMFNDILGTTLGVDGESGYTSTPLTAFGDAAGGPQSLAAASPESFFTGKPLVPGLGHAFLFRNYRASLGKWLTADPLGYPDGWKQLAYCENCVSYCIDFCGAAKLTICSSATGEASCFNVSGHSWLVYEDDKGVQTTYGTWGNNPDNKRNGLHENLEQGRPSDASRTVSISSDQEDTLKDVLNEYRQAGENAWSLTHPCSDFAADVWKRVTGEDLSSFWPWDTPSGLRIPSSPRMVM